MLERQDKHKPGSSRRIQDEMYRTFFRIKLGLLIKELEARQTLTNSTFLPSHPRDPEVEEALEFFTKMRKE